MMLAFGFPATTTATTAAASTTTILAAAGWLVGCSLGTRAVHNWLTSSVRVWGQIDEVARVAYRW